MKLFGRKREPVMENRFKPKVEPPREKRFGRRKSAQSGRPGADAADPGANRRHEAKTTKPMVKPITLLGSLFDGTVLTNQAVMKNLPYILFVVLLAILYISNSSSAEKNRRYAIKLDEELKELRYEYISTKSAVMYLSNPSTISERLKEKGFEDNLMPPVKIFIPKTQQETTNSSK